MSDSLSRMSSDRLEAMAFFAKADATSFQAISIFNLMASDRVGGDRVMGDGGLIFWAKLSQLTLIAAIVTESGGLSVVGHLARQGLKPPSNSESPLKRTRKHIIF